MIIRWIPGPVSQQTRNTLAMGTIYGRTSFAPVPMFGPPCMEASQFFVPGQAAGQVFVPGPAQAQVFAPGMVAEQVKC